MYFLKSKFLKVSVVFMMALVMFISQSIMPVTTNASINEEEAKLLEMYDDLKEFAVKYEDASKETVNALKKDVNKLVADKKIILSEKSAKLDFTKLVVKEDESSQLVYIPIKYNALKKGLLNESFFVVVFEKSELSYYQEIKIIGNQEEYTSNVSSYLNGSLLNEETIYLEKEDFETTSNDENSSIFAFLAPDTAEAGWYDNFKKCLNDKGVAAWIITSISIACSAACIATAGAGCVACILGLALLSEGVISYCVFKARV